MPTIVVTPEDVLFAVIPAGNLLLHLPLPSSNGPSNIPEFGTVKDPYGFKALYEMAAYEHVVPGTKYPATLVTAGANDPNVAPWQGAKMASRLQAANAGSKPILFRVNYDAGHGITDTIAQQVSDWTDVFTFFFWNFGNPDFQPTVIAHATTPAAYGGR